MARRSCTGCRSAHCRAAAAGGEVCQGVTAVGPTANTSQASARCWKQLMYNCCCMLFVSADEHDGSCTSSCSPTRLLAWYNRGPARVSRNAHRVVSLSLPSLSTAELSGHHCLCSRRVQQLPPGRAASSGECAATRPHTVVQAHACDDATNPSFVCCLPPAVAAGRMPGPAVGVS